MPKTQKAFLQFSNKMNNNDKDFYGDFNQTIKLGFVNYIIRPLQAV